jgi:hypothetical protein
MNPYEPPRSGNSPPPDQPRPPENGGRKYIAISLSAIGVAILVRLLWWSRYPTFNWIEGSIGVLCMLTGIGILWQLRAKRKL